MNDEILEILKRLSPQQKATLVCGAGQFESAGIAQLNIPSLIFSDGSQGLRRQRSLKDHLGLFPSIPSTCFPAASSLACSWDRHLCFQVGEAMGKEARKAGVDVLLAPALNLIRHPLGGRNFEYFSEDPCLGGELSAAMVEGIQESVSACPKHFLLNSQETYRMSIDERASEQTIMELYLPAFERMIRRSHPDWIMSAYNKVNGIYASENPQLLKNLLRDHLGFDGAVVTDWGGGNQITEAIAAGSTLEMPSTQGQSEKAILEALCRGDLSEQDLDERVAEMLKAIRKVEGNRNKPETQFSLKLHHRLALAAAVKSIVLLKNRNRILPLDCSEKVCFIGDFEHTFPFQGSGSASVNSAVRENFRKLAQEYSHNHALFARGYQLYSDQPSPFLESRAVKTAEKADVIVFLGALPPIANTEGIDRTFKDLPKNQSALIRRLAALKKPLILADAISGAIEMRDEKYFDAILYLGLNGQASREAMLSILYGDKNPSGHLAFTMACRIDQHALESGYPARGPMSLHSEGEEIGYRYFSRSRIPVRYPFGFGLSYSDYEIRDAFFDQNGVRFFIQNTSERTGSALVQMYRAFRDDPEEISAAILCGFERIRLRPNEIREGFIPFDEYTFRRYLPQQHRYAVLKGEVQISLRWNADDVCWSDTWFIQDGEDLMPELAPVMPVSYKEQEWPLTLETPIAQFVNAPNRKAAALIGKISRIRERSFEKNRPNLVLSAFLDMPLKSLCKLYPSFMSFDKAQNILHELRMEKQNSVSETVRLLSLAVSASSSAAHKDETDSRDEERKDTEFRKIGS